MLWFFLVSSSPLPQWLIFRLENQYKSFGREQPLQEQIPFILVLGGGQSFSPQLPASIQLSSTALVRTGEGIRIHKLVLGSKLIFSGNSLSGRTTIAENASIAAIELGIPPEDTLQLRGGSNTAEEVLAFKKRFGNVPVILVTSASHMPRAMMICRYEGINAIPAPTEFLLKPDPDKSPYEFLPSWHKIELMQRVMHEWLATLKWKIVK